MEAIGIVIVSFFTDTSKINCVYRVYNARYVKKDIFTLWHAISSDNVTVGSYLGSTLDNIFKCILE